MKKVAVACLACAAAVYAWTPLFESATTIKIAGMDPVDLPIDYWGNGNFLGYFTPTFVDLNGDGRRDLVAGLFDGGQILYAYNTGTATAPSFNAYDFFKTSDDGGTTFAQPL